MRKAGVGQAGTAGITYSFIQRGLRGMFALASAAQGLNSTLVIVVIAAVVVAFFWRFLLKVGIAVLVIGFVFVFVSAVLAVVHGLHALIP